jgi:hypothetical protein
MSAFEHLSAILILPERKTPDFILSYTIGGLFWPDRRAQRAFWLEMGRSARLFCGLVKLVCSRPC